MTILKERSFFAFIFLLHLLFWVATGQLARVFGCTFINYTIIHGELIQNVN
jgi:hypothetical protein